MFIVHPFYFQSSSSSCQTIVSTLDVDDSVVGEVTAEDLCSDEPSAAYWKALVEVTEQKLDTEFDRSLNVSV